MTEMDLRTADARTRQRLETDLDATLFVEAGAGTGKTTAIVGRITELIAAGLLRTDALVAITFTEAAAAELRARVREKLESEARSRPDPVQRERCAEAAASLDLAAIDTIHAFAGDLLRSFPLEAGLPPGFQVLDEIEHELRFRERFGQWFESAGEDPALRAVVTRCLLLGMKPDRIRELAQHLGDNSDALGGHDAWPSIPPPPAVEAAHEAGAAIREAEQLVQLSPNPGHPLIAVVEGLAFAGERLRQAGDDHAALTALQSVTYIADKGSGSQTGWPPLADGTNACKALKKLLTDLVNDSNEVVAAHRQSAFTALLSALVAFTSEFEAERRRDGIATFHDLLAWARNLVRDDAGMRARARSRWSRIFVDEFQDTDPLQAELAFHLAGRGDEAPSDWRATELVPGKLCLVGDPKQSIYRFRRADIALYQQLLARFGGAEPLALNFRSVPGVVGFANLHFARTMTAAEGAQAPYQPLVTDIPAAGSPIWTVGGLIPGKQEEVWRQEAAAVAEVAARVVGEGWTVSEGKGELRRSRRARWSDVCILMPTRRNLRRLEREFERWNIPYRVESGELVVATQEVRDLVSCLRAIDDPSDQVALVAALRSAVYGVSDVELLEWVESGGRLNHQSQGEGTVERVGLALSHLDLLHQLRHELSVPALVGRLIDDRELVATAFGQRRPREVWRRYRYVAARARAFASTGRSTLREFVEWMEGLERENARDAAGSIIESDEDAVRLLTVHRAKGLEFPVVIMTGLGSDPGFRAPAVIIDRATGAVEVGGGKGGWSSQGYEQAKGREKLLYDAEQVRLCYVAATRARDHLVMSLFRSERATGVAAVTMARSVADFGGVTALEVGVLEPPPAPSETEPTNETVEQFDARERGWVAARAAVLRERAGIKLASATSLAHLEAAAAGDDGEDPVRPEPAGTEISVSSMRRGRGGTALGRAVHAVLQTIDLRTLERLGSQAHARAASEGIPELAGRVADLVRLACGTEPVARAAAARHWREVPVASSLEGVVLEGFVDLLYETEAGVGVIDYKTDDISPGEVERRLERYRIQGGAYALLIEETTGRAVVSVDFVFAALGVARPLEDLEGAKAEVRRLLAGVEPAELLVPVEAT